MSFPRDIRVSSIESLLVVPMENLTFIWTEELSKLKLKKTKVEKHDLKRNYRSSMTHRSVSINIRAKKLAIRFNDLSFSLFIKDSDDDNVDLPTIIIRFLFCRFTSTS